MDQQLELSNQIETRTNLIVNYLPQSLTDHEFKQMFECIGPTTSCKIIRDKASNYSFGYGFVSYNDPQLCLKAIKSLNGYSIQHKTLKVAFSREGDEVKNANLYISHVPKTMTQAQVQLMFEPYGKIIQCRLLRDADGNSKGTGFVLFNSQAEAQDAITGLDGKPPPGFSDGIRVKFAEENKGKKGLAAATKAISSHEGVGRGGNGAGMGEYSQGGYSSGFFPGGFSSPGGIGGPIRGSVASRGNRFNPIGRDPLLGYNTVGDINSRNSGIGTGVAGFNDSVNIGINSQPGYTALNYKQENFTEDVFDLSTNISYPISAVGSSNYNSGGYGMYGASAANFRRMGVAVRGGFQQQNNSFFSLNSDLSHCGKISGRGCGNQVNSLSASSTSMIQKGTHVDKSLPSENLASPDSNNPDGVKIFAYNIGLQADQMSLFKLFAPFGPIQKVDVIWDYTKNQSKGFGFVTFVNYANAAAAVKALDGYKYLEKPLQVSFKKDN